MVFNAHTLEAPDIVKYLLLSFSYWILFCKVREMVEAHDVLVDAEKLNAFCRRILIDIFRVCIFHLPLIALVEVIFEEKIKHDLVAIILFLALFVVVVLDLLIRSYPVWSIVWMYKGLTEGLLVHL